MTDIVERARGFLDREKRASSFAEAGDCSIACGLLREAVDEVEKLQEVKGKRLVLAAEVVKLEDEVARLRKGIQDYLDGNWDGPHRMRKTDQCSHGRFQWEACEACADLYFQGLLTSETSPSLT